MREKINNKYISILFICVLIIMCIFVGRDVIYAEETGIKINETNFPDENFRNYVLVNIDKDGDRILSNEEIMKTTTIAVDEMNISDLSGIKYFTYLNKLYCGYNSLSKLDLSGLTNLSTLHCNDNMLNELNITGLYNLEYLIFENNNLSNFDNFDFTNYNKLVYLDCANNNLEKLNLKGLTNLKSLLCQENLISNLDLKGLNNLEGLVCFNNTIKELNFEGLNKLTYINCSNNGLKKLNVNNQPKLDYLNCSHNQIENLYLKNLSELTYVVCRSNNINELKLEGLSNLKKLFCDGNNIKELNLQDSKKIDTLECNANLIEKMDLSGLTNLERLVCSNNLIKELNLKDLVNIKEIYASRNNLPAINPEDNLQLESMIADRQEIKIVANKLKDVYEIDLTQLPGVDKFKVRLEENQNGYRYDEKRGVVTIDKNLGEEGIFTYYYRFPKEYGIDVLKSEMEVEVLWNTSGFIDDVIDETTEDGWVKFNDYWYYIKDGEIVKDKWIFVELDLDGETKKNWKYFNRKGYNQETFYIEKRNWRCMVKSSWSK